MGSLLVLFQLNSLDRLDCYQDGSFPTPRLRHYVSMPLEVVGKYRGRNLAFCVRSPFFYCEVDLKESCGFGKADLTKLLIRSIGPVTTVVQLPLPHNNRCW